jgi:hypothetical protein
MRTVVRLRHDHVIIEDSKCRKPFKQLIFQLERFARTTNINITGFQSNIQESSLITCHMPGSVQTSNLPSEREEPGPSTQPLSRIHPPVPDIEYVLNCWVLGDEPHQVFTINVSQNTKVGVFQELIRDKNKPAFDNLRPHSLELWQVSERL